MFSLILTQETIFVLQKAALLALLVALGSGVAIGLQGTSNSWAGRIIGSISTGLLVNIAGGLVAILIILPFMFRQSGMPWVDIRTAVPFIIISGILGIGIIAGIAYSFPRLGIAAGLSVIILGQMLIAIVVDSLGWAGSDPIPFSLTRLVGLMILMLGTWLLLPSN
jgi:transporter family-2 protein